MQHDQRPPSRAAIIQLVAASLHELLIQAGRSDGAPPDETTPLVGPESGLDSLMLVTLIVDVEQRLEEEYGIAVAIADDRALSQRNSPFRSIRSLTDYVLLLVRRNGDDRP